MPALVADSPPMHDVRFDEAVPRLAELFAPVVALLVQLRSTDDYGDPERLRQHTRDLLAEAEQAARAAGAPEEDVRDAAFALVAFLDEAVLSSGWSQRDAWMARPLQLERFERYDAGEAFFDRLDALLGQPHRAEVLEVYYLCLVLGFKGRYQIHGQDELRRLVERAYAALERAPGLSAPALAPHGTPRDRAADAVRQAVPPWVLLVAAAGVALLVYLGMSVYVSDAAGDTAGVVRSLSTMAPR